MTRLYIVEGLPCSGKSTTSQYMAKRLAAMDKKVVCFDEGTGEHPADYEFSAYIGRGDLSRLEEPLRERVRGCSALAEGGWIVPLAQFSGRDLAQLLPYKIYDSLPWETEMPLMLDKWQSFVSSAAPDAVYVFNCVLLQNPMCETMMRFGFPQEQSFGYISKIAAIATPLAPAVVYLKTDRISQSIMAASKERPGWLEAVMDYHCSGRYGQSIHAQGFEGYIACLEERQRRELSILAKLPLRQLVLDGPQRDWDAAYRQLDSFLAAETC